MAAERGGLTPWYACCLYLTGKTGLLGAAGAEPPAGPMGVSMQGLLQATHLTPMEFFDHLENFARLVDFAPAAAAAADSAAPGTGLVALSSERVRDHAGSMLKSLEITTFMYNKFSSIFEQMFPPPPAAAPAEPLPSDPTTSSVLE